MNSHLSQARLPAISMHMIKYMRGFTYIFAIWFYMGGIAEALTIQGTQVLENGKPVRLKGINIGDPLLARVGRSVSDYFILRNDWHINTVRISIHPGTWKKFGKAHTLTILAKNIDAAQAAGLYVIIDWHAIGVPDGYTQKAAHGLMHDLYDTQFSLAEDFWQEVTHMFGDDERIIFELWNEPVFSPRPDFNALHWRTLKPYWQKLTQQIRTTSNNVILVTGSGWSYNLREIKESPMEASNIAYAWHIYAGTQKDNIDHWYGALADVHHVAPIFITEWGFNPKTKNTWKDNQKTYGAAMRNHFLGNKTFHPIAWVWHPHWMPAMIEEDWKTPTLWGAFAKETLATY